MMASCRTLGTTADPWPRHTHHGQATSGGPPLLACFSTLDWVTLSMTVLQGPWGWGKGPWTLEDLIIQQGLIVYFNTFPGNLKKNINHVFHNAWTLYYDQTRLAEDAHGMHTNCPLSDWVSCGDEHLQLLMESITILCNLQVYKECQVVISVLGGL